MVVVCGAIKKVIAMSDNGQKDKQLDLDFLYKRMAVVMKEILIILSSKVKVHKNFEAETYTQGST